MSTDPLIKKYTNKSPEEMEKEQDELQAEHIAKCQALDQEIHRFSSKTDDLIVDGKQLAVVKRPTTEQFNRLVPPKLAKYRNEPEKISVEEAKAYEDDVYKLMEELIVMPKHDAKWWKENTGDDFVAAFQAHVVKTRTKMEERIKDFL